MAATPKDKLRPGGEMRELPVFVNSEDVSQNVSEGRPSRREAEEDKEPVVKNL